MAVDLDRLDASDELNVKSRRWWRVVTTSLVSAILLEAVFAGAILSGVSWARAAHAATAVLILVSTIAASVVALGRLRDVPHGLKLGLTLLSLAAVVFLQAAVGILSAKGANLLWVHVPLGVALVGLAGQAVAGASRLGGKE